jgi:two-component system sensor histidine kinase ChvG
MAALIIPILGLLHLDQYQASLLAAEIESLQVQGRAFALSLINVAAVSDERGENLLKPLETRQQMRVLFSDTGVRARVFGQTGELIADSYVLSGTGARIQVIELEPPDDRWLPDVWRIFDAAVDYLPLTNTEDLPLYREAAVQRASDYPEVEVALAGESGGRVRLDRRRRLVFTVALPVKRYRQVLGALMLSKDGDDLEAAVDSRRRDIVIVFGIALAMTILLSLYLAGTLARPLYRLARAVDLVRHGQGRTYEIPDFTSRGDEIGDLSGALREMTAALRARLHAIEGFAADVAHEIKNPLSSLRSAVETVSRIKDPDQQRKLMTIIVEDVERLDRLITDISDASRLDAELSRAELEDVDLAILLSTLVEVHQISGAQDSGEAVRFELRVPEGAALFVQGLEGRLGQVFRNIISNAITFSPPGGTIRMVVARQGEMIQVLIEDDGPGLPEGKLEAIFDRFYSERPSAEKFGTHSGLGLSISKQIMDAHGGLISAENRRDAQGNISGARFKIVLPALDSILNHP